jgi:mannitol-1-phosphate 5-dehydrogenase
LKIAPKRIVIFGAGKIGRSFIGQLFSRGGYELVFVDVDKELVRLLNNAGSYKVLIKDVVEKEIVVNNIRAVDGSNKEELVREVAHAGILAVSVGKNALAKIIPAIARGLELRFSKDQNTTALDIILAENMRSAAAFVKENLESNLPADFPIDERVGLIETSIGKMVPIMTKADITHDPLQVFAEAYNDLILDKRGFRNPIPDIQGLAPMDNIAAWVDRKAFIHNLGHSAAAYFGFYHHSEMQYMYQILNDTKVYRFTKAVMQQAANVLLAVYPEDFTSEDLQHHIDDLLGRFKNQALGDTVFRVGQDLRRKLGEDDRFVGLIKMAKSLQMPYDRILEAFSYGFLFRGRDEHQQESPADRDFLRECKMDIEKVLIETSGLEDPSVRRKVITLVKKLQNPSLSRK